MNDRHLGERAPVTGVWTDNVARWNEKVLPDYPEARYTFDAPWFYGALRDADDVLRADDLGRLIDRLMAREHYPEGTPGL